VNERPGCGERQKDEQENEDEGHGEVFHDLASGQTWAFRVATVAAAPSTTVMPFTGSLAYGDRSLVTGVDDIHERGLLPRLAVATGFARRRLCDELQNFR
jgi:hypothetical protein